MSKQASSQVLIEIQKTKNFSKDAVNVVIDGVPFKVNATEDKGKFYLYAHPGR